MTVTKVALLHSEGGEGANSVSYSLRYGVWTNDRDDGPLVVRNAVPWIYGDPYINGNDSDPRALALSIRERPASSSHYNHWFVDVEFGLVETDRDLSNPLNDPITQEVSWGGETRRVFVDADDNFIVNSANQIYPDGLEAEDNTPSLSYSLNQVSFPFALAQAVRNAINSTSWKGFSAGTVKLASMRSGRQFDKSIGVYYSVEYAFKVVPEGFEVKAPSMGYAELVTEGAGKKLKPILNGGKLTVTPQPLDADGKWIRLASDGSLASAAHIQSYQLYPQLDFNALFPFL